MIIRDLIAPVGGPEEVGDERAADIALSRNLHTEIDQVAAANEMSASSLDHGLYQTAQSLTRGVSEELELLRWMPR